MPFLSIVGRMLGLGYKVSESIKKSADMTKQITDNIYLPNEVVGLQIEKGMSPIAAWRTYKGLSQQQLADQLGVSQPAIAQLEREGSKPHC
jgi:DNA-binding XRE family transcriptional regulator